MNWVNNKIRTKEKKHKKSLNQFVDTHCHLYDEQFADDIENTIQKAVVLGVNKMYLPNCDRTTIEPMLRLTNRWPNHCFAMMGVHPCYIKENYQEELKIAEQYLNQQKFSAIGEIGLDYYWDTTHVAAQKQAFDLQMDWALQHSLPIVIHSRESLPDCIAQVRKKQNGNLRGIFHCFSGTASEAQEIVDLGFYLGIGGVLTFKKSTLPDSIKDIGLDKLVLETDAPYLAPVPYRGKRNESSYIPLIAEKLADLKQTDLGTVAAVTTANAQHIFETKTP